jgi:peptidyl-prolyl cis-trans isomerase C
MSRALLRFLLLGGLLFAATRGLAPAREQALSAASIRIPAAEVAALRRGFVNERARPPQPEEMAALVAARVDEEVLFREALAEGLDRDDPVVLRRLVENARFLSDGGGDAGAQLRAVDALGMRLSDPVVRRRLVNRMRLRLAEAAGDAPPSAEDLARERARRAEALQIPARVRISQVYLGPAPALALPRTLPFQSEEMLARSFGPAFARAVFRLPPGRWSGPLRSAHGSHRVRVEAREEARAPSSDAVSNQLRDTIVAEREARAVELALRTLRLRHPVVVEAEARS